MEQQTATNPTTKVKDAILANLSATLGADAVEVVEWAAVDDTRLAIRNANPLPNFDEFVGDENSEVAL